jgi:dolichyl-phosphate-mannose-protein mannosyltransferase
MRLLEFPLERDEGEYACAGQLILRGVPPYLQAYNMKLPGVYAAYAAVMAIFGETVGAIHIGLILVNSASIVLVFLLAKRLFDPVAGLVACASFALLSVSPSVLGMAAHATHFVALPALGGLVLLLRASDSRRLFTLFFGGLLFGLAFLMKQPGIFFIIFGLLYLFWEQLKTRPAAWGKSLMQLAAFLLGAVVPFGLTCLILFASGVFNKFWFWTFSYASQYASEVPAAQMLPRLWQSIQGVVGPSICLWVLAGVGLISLWTIKERRQNAIFVSGLFVFSFLAVCPGFYFREHYFIPFLPVIAVLAGVAVSSARNLLQKRFTPAMQLLLPLLVFLSAFGYSVIQQQEFLFRMSPESACRARYGRNPFPESLEIAKYIKANSAAGDRIAVIGSEPQIYFYADRRPATGYIYTYGLMEEQKYALEMQQEMIGEIEAAQPAYLIFINVPMSWLVRPRSEMLIFEWYKRYQQEHYDLVGLVDILPSDPTVYRWGDESKNYLTRSQYSVSVYKLRNSG